MTKKTSIKKISTTKKTVKKVVEKPQSKTVKKTIVKPILKKDKLTKVDTNILEQSFELVKKLSSQVKKVELSKNQIKNDLVSLAKKVESNEKESNEPKKDILSVLKNELIKEFEPILNKLNSKTKTDYIFKEINSLLELEIKKLNSEFSSKQTKSKKEVTKRFSELEFRILDSIRLNETLKKEFKKFENKKVSAIFLEIENKIKDVLNSTNKKIHNLIKTNSSELDDIKLNFTSQKTSITSLTKSVTKLKEDIRELGKQDSLDLTSVVSKTSNLEKEISSLKSLIEKHEDELYNRKENESIAIENKVKKMLEQSKQNFEVLEIAQKELEKTLLEKVKEFFDTDGAKLLKSYLIKSQKTQSKNISDEVETKFNELKLKIDLDLKESLDKFSNEKEKLEMGVQKVKNEFLENVKEYIDHLDIELKTLKKENQHFEKSKKIHFAKVDEKIKTDVIILEKKIKENNNNFNKILSSVNIEKIKQRDYIASKYNELVDAFDKLRIDNEILLNSAKGNFSKELDTKFINLIKETKEDLSNFTKQNYSVQEILSTKINDNLLIFENKIKENDIIFNKSIDDVNIEKTKQRDYIASKYNELVNIFDKLRIDNEISLNSAKGNFSKELDTKFTNLIKETKEDLSSQLISNKEYLTRLGTQNQEQQRTLSEQIETKLILTKEQFEQEFRNNLTKFDTELQEKESYFINKLEIIDKEKTQTHKELVDFKEEIGDLTKNYVSHLDEELQKIKIEESQFEDKKKEILSEIYNLSKTKQIQLNEYSDQLQINLKNIIDEEKSQFERNENAFREVFGKKVRTLELQTQKKLEQIETKLLDKNIKAVESKLVEEIKVIDLLEERINAKLDLIDTKSALLESKEQDFESNVQSQTVSLKEKVEVRLTDLEKQLNRRFLDLDLNFTTFKGVVVDEVEDLMLDVNNILKTKVEGVDKRFAKLNFVNNEATNKLSQLNHQYQRFDNQYNDIRDEVNDLRVKFDIVSPDHSLNDHIHYMKTYEEQLIALIRNLRNKGIPNNSIQNALVQKGHPRFYVKMMLEDFDTIFT